MFKKKEEKQYNQYDEWYENRRLDYNKNLKGMVEEYKQVKAISNLEKVFINEWPFSINYEEAYNRLRQTINDCIYIYNELVTYHYQYHEEMNKCKDWDKTLLKPEAWLMKEEMK